MISRLVTYAVGGVAAVLVVTAVYWSWHSAVYDRGYRDGAGDAIAAVREQNERAAEAAREGINRARACRDAGGVWSTVDGACHD